MYIIRGLHHFFEDFARFPANPLLLAHEVRATADDEQLVVVGVIRVVSQVDREGPVQLDRDRVVLSVLRLDERPALVDDLRVGPVDVRDVVVEVLESANDLPSLFLFLKSSGQLAFQISSAASCPISLAYLLMRLEMRS